jgi:hypothetical protein
MKEKTMQTANQSRNGCDPTQQRQALEALAVEAHARGDTWAQFWPTVAADVSALELDYVSRGRLIHRLVGLVASGDTDGMHSPGDGWPPEADSEPPMVPVVDDVTTRARLLWSPERGATR